MQTIEEMRTALQKEKLEGREPPWGYRLLQRGPSIFITRILIHTPLSPNMISVLSILSGMAGGAVILLPTLEWKLCGLCLLYLHLLLDRVDGEVARYKKIFSLRGVYLDEINHYLVPAFFFSTLGWSVAKVSLLDPRLIMLSGFVGAIASIMLRLTHNLPYGIFIKKFSTHRELFPTTPTTRNTISEMRKRHSFIYPILYVFHQLQDFLITIILFAGVLIVEHVYAPNAMFHPYVSYLLMGYALVLSLIVIENLTKGILTIESRMHELEHTHKS
jgi:phosphatidylglycerophosphate synthase